MRLLTLSLLFLTSPAWAIDTCYLAKVTSAGKLNIRESASEKAKIMGRLGSGLQIAVVEDSKDWLRIIAGNFTGAFVSKTALTLGAKCEFLGYVIEDSARIRAEPRVTGKFLVKGSVGKTFVAKKVNEEWLEIMTAPYTGAFIASKLVQLTELSE